VHGLEFLVERKYFKKTTAAHEVSTLDTKADVFSHILKNNITGAESMADGRVYPWTIVHPCG
jgi:hypothetical protein